MPDTTISAPNLNFLGIAGSLRRGSYNRGLIRAAVELSPKNVAIAPFEIRDIPLYDGDVEAVGDPVAVERFKQAIDEADGLVIATPEYNHCIPGVLKNAIDWASRPAQASALSGKPVAIMGASTGRGGTARAQAHLRDGLAFTGGIVLPLPEVLVPLASQSFDANGDLVDEDVRTEVRDLLVSFSAWVRRLADQGVTDSDRGRKSA
jgi:chromate reductase